MRHTTATVIAAAAVVVAGLVAATVAGVARDDMRAEAHRRGPR